VTDLDLAETSARHPALAVITPANTSRRRIRTQIAVIGAGPAGLVLANVLLRAGIDICLVERHTRQAVERRARAGLLEHHAVAYLHSKGLADGLLKDGTRHGWCDFLCLGQQVRLDYAVRTGGAHHWVYPQQHLVRDLISSLERTGHTPRFGRAVEGVSLSGPGGRPRVHCPGLVIDCDYVVGCDGHHGIARTVFPADVRGDVVRRYPYDWLTLLVETDRPVHGVLYALHERGFAGVMPRTRDLARLYLQIPRREVPESWSLPRVRTELGARLAGAAVSPPRVLRVMEKGVLRMRSTISQRLQHGRLFLAGDAGHVLTPSGAKGMNLAIADAADLAEAFIRHYDGRVLEAPLTYTVRRLRHVRRAQNLSDTLLRLLHLPSTAPAGASLRARLGQLHRLTAADDPYGIAFAHQYVGSGSGADRRDAPLSPPHRRPPTPRTSA
jgi:p-hydroxybenzoate 3-monooxygenase